MDEKSIKINGVDYIPKGSVVTFSQAPKNKKGMSFVIVRCRLAGVLAGWFDEKRMLKDGVLELHHAITLWEWWSKFTLSALATSGVLPSKVSEVRFSEPAIKRLIPKEDIGDIIFCTKKAQESITSITPHTNA